MRFSAPQLAFGEHLSALTQLLAQEGRLIGRTVIVVNLISNGQLDAISIDEGLGIGHIRLWATQRAIRPRQFMGDEYPDEDIVPKTYSEIRDCLFDNSGQQCVDNGQVEGVSSITNPLVGLDGNGGLIGGGWGRVVKGKRRRGFDVLGSTVGSACTECKRARSGHDENPPHTGPLDSVVVRRSDDPSGS